MLQRRSSEGVYATLPVLLPQGAVASRVAAVLAERAIETRRWYCPTLERHPAFSRLPVAGELRVTEALSERLLALPFHTRLDDGDVQRVCDELAAALRN